MSNSPNFLLDENIPKSVKRLLKSEGFPAEYEDKGLKNSRLISLAKEKEAILVSRDSDFTNTSLYPPTDFFGIIVFKIHPPKAKELVRALSLLLEDVEEFKGKLFVVEKEGFEEID